MPSVIRKRGKYYHYDTNSKNGRVRLSLRTSNYKVALREKKKLDEIYVNTYPWDKPRFTVTVDKVIEDHIRWLEIYKSPQWAERQKQIFKKFQQFNKTKFIHGITAADIEKYMMRQIVLGIKPATIRKELHVLKGLWDRALRDRYVESNVVTMVKAPRDREPKEARCFTKEEVKMIIDDQKGKPMQLIIATLYYTGLRLGDVISMKSEEIDLKNGRYKKRIEKTGKIMKMPLAEPLIEILKGNIPESGPAFPNFYPESYNRKNIIRRNILRDFKSILRCLNIPDGCLHSFRHTFTNELMKMGLSLEEIKALLGHASISTTLIYTHPNEELARSYLDRLKT